MHHACPHHAEALTRHPVGGWVTWRCNHCEGIWVPADVVKRAVKSPRWPQKSALKSTDLRCPDDGRALSAFTTRGIELDWCAHCHGVWLDRGELATIMAQRDAQPAQHESNELVEEITEELWDLDFTANSSRSGTSSATPQRADPDQLRVEYDTPPSTPSTSQPGGDVDVSAAADISDNGVFEQATEFAGDAFSAVFEFIGDAFSAID